MFRQVDDNDSITANRRWWNAYAQEYQEDHAHQLGKADFTWGPEGLTEATAGLLGPVSGKTIVEVGCGAAQCSRWLAAHGAHVIGVDIAVEQLMHSRAIDAESGTTTIGVLAAHAGALPLADSSCDLAFASYGALQFVADAAGVFEEVFRVLAPGGRWVFSVTHPIRWAFLDDPGPGGLHVERSYFDRRAYAEYDTNGHLTYCEHHHTLADWVTLITGAGFALTRVVEPEWTDPARPDWEGWSKLRGELIPGTIIFSCDKPG